MRATAGPARCFPTTDEHRQATRLAEHVSPRAVFTVPARPMGEMSDDALAVELHLLALHCEHSHPDDAAQLQARAELLYYRSAHARARTEHLSQDAIGALFASVPARCAAAEEAATTRYLAEQADAARDAEDLWDQRDAAQAHEYAEAVGGA